MEKEKIEKLAFLEIHGDGEVYKDALKLATKWYVRGYQQAQEETIKTLKENIKQTQQNIDLVDSVNKWIKNDVSPEKNGTYLVYNVYSEAVEIADYNNGNWTAELAGECVNYNDIITDWMERPQPPKH